MEDKFVRGAAEDTVHQIAKTLIELVPVAAGFGKEKSTLIKVFAQLAHLAVGKPRALLAV